MLIVDVFVDKKSRLMDKLDNCPIPKITGEIWDIVSILPLLYLLLNTVDFISPIKKLQLQIATQ